MVAGDDLKGWGGGSGCGGGGTPTQCAGAAWRYALPLTHTAEATPLRTPTRPQLPKRLARRLLDLQLLPYIVVTNPHIKKVYNQYYISFGARVSRIESGGQSTQWQEWRLGLLCCRALRVLPTAILPVSLCNTAP